jgi:hypothetical protein
VCLGGDFTASGQSNLPYRGVDSTYSNRFCSSGDAVLDPDTGLPISVTPTTETCNHYEQEEIAQIPHISTNVLEALDFLGKDDDGFFLMYEQGDVSTVSYLLDASRHDHECLCYVNRIRCIVSHLVSELACAHHFLTNL